MKDFINDKNNQKNMQKGGELMKNEGIGPLLYQLQFEVMTLWEDSDTTPEMDDAFKKIYDMIETLTEKLQHNNEDMITRDSVKYLTDQVVENAKMYKMFGKNVKSRTDTCPIYSVNDIKREMADLITLSKYMV